MEELNGRPSARLSVTESADGAGLVVAFGGELDIASLPAVTPALDALLSRGPQPVRLDLAELEFLDSSGVALLVRIANHFDRVRTARATEPVRRVLEVLALADRLGLDQPSGTDDRPSGDGA
jgi:anti-sigma B factor antagonist